MKISTSRDIAAPPEAVFAALSDFDRHEAEARAGGIEVVRLDDGRDPAAARLRITAPIHGLRRTITARVTICAAPGRLVLAAESDGIAARISAEVTPRPGAAARLRVSVDLAPETLRARLVLHSLKLARGPVTDRLDRRIDRFARSVETTA